MNSQHPHGGSGAAPYDRDREMEERHRAIQQHEEMARRDQERERDRERENRDRDRERESNERFQPSAAAPHHSSSAGSIPIHQPVASRTTTQIHSPSGILGNYNGAGAPNAPLGGGGGGGSSGGGAPPGSVVSFGGPLQPSEQHGRQGQHGGQSNAGAQHQMFAPMPHSQGPAGGSQSAAGPSAAAAAAAAVFGGGLQPQQQQQQSQQPGQQDGRGGQQAGPPYRGVTPGGHQIPGGITQGQQPILNVSGISVHAFYLLYGMCRIAWARCGLAHRAPVPVSLTVYRCALDRGALSPFTSRTLFPLSLATQPYPPPYFSFPPFPPM